MTETLTSIRRITLTKGNLAIHLALMTGVNDLTLSYWEVRVGGRMVKHGDTERTGVVAEVLQDVVANTTLRTSAMDVALRSLTWAALNNHEHVPASELRAGDLLHVGGTNYVLIKSAEVDGDIVRLRFEGNSEGVEHRYPMTQLCNLSGRDLQP
jgi:hypothetical protein